MRCAHRAAPTLCLCRASPIPAAAGVNIGFDVGSVPSITINPGQFLTLMETGPKVWQVIGATAEVWRNALPFVAGLPCNSIFTEMWTVQHPFEIGGGSVVFNFFTSYL